MNDSSFLQADDANDASWSGGELHAVGATHVGWQSDVSDSGRLDLS